MLLLLLPHVPAVLLALALPLVDVPSADVASAVDGPSLYKRLLAPALAGDEWLAWAVLAAHAVGKHGSILIATLFGVWSGVVLGRAASAAAPSWVLRWRVHLGRVSQDLGIMGAVALLLWTFSVLFVAVSMRRYAADTASPDAARLVVLGYETYHLAFYLSVSGALALGLRWLAHQQSLLAPPSKRQVWLWTAMGLSVMALRPLAALPVLVWVYVIVTSLRERSRALDDELGELLNKSVSAVRDSSWP